MVLESEDASEGDLGSTKGTRSDSDKSSDKTKTSVGKEGSDDESNKHNRLPESTKESGGGDKSRQNKPSDEHSEESIDGDKGTKGNRLRVVRSNSSPALFDASKKKTIGERGKYDSCQSLSDVTEVLFSTSKKDQTAKHSKAKKEEEDSRRERTKICEDRQTESQNISKTPCNPEGPVAPAASAPPKRQTSPRKINDSRRTKRRSSLPAKRGDEAVRIDRINGQRRSSCHQQMKDSTSNYQANKASRKPKVTDKHKRNTFPGSSASNATALPTTKSKEAQKKDLLSRFITYNDQLPQPAPKSNRRYEQLPQNSPKRETRLSSLTSARQREHTQASLQRKEASSDGVQRCTIQHKHQASSLHTPESQRQTGLLKSPSTKLNKGGSPPLSSTQWQPRSKLPMFFDTLRIALIMFSTASIVGRSFVAFGGKMPLVHYLVNSPILWIVRWYIATFHVVLLIVEMDFGVPVIIPRKTLDNFLQKGYLVSFIGLLDLCMNSNKSLVDIVDELQGDEGELSDRGIRMRCAYAVLGISSRGMIACGSIYFLLGILGYNGESRRRAIAQGPAGLPKTPNSKQMASI